MKKKIILCASVVAFAAAGAVNADSKKGDDNGTARNNCPVTHAALENAIKAAQLKANGGLGFHMWATVVNADGVVCAVAKSGNGLNSQWLGSRVISAQKANTANSFSLTAGGNAGNGLDGLALSTANLYAPTQPGGSLFGLQHSNPVDTQWAYAGNANKFGRADDPMTGRRIGGVNVFGGGLALYNSEHKLVGAVGVSGDTSCADHNIAWRVRDLLALDNVMAGVAGVGDNIIFDATSAAPNGIVDGFEHAACAEDVQDNINANTAVLADAPIGPNP
ncbi:heme-binding protein [Methylomonas sp. LL1]|uniref:GlcG/HbpS family heme-binding protein n=1 Tax=Methylomonas sp. LL1 TaxID=2785785 RepID=UPI0018C3BAA6|nr:heme-binding protein [Methylomonas sp. LL1]QPK63879.1 heme-binding protein [Methylomonas sp. LL1]